jgi:hypothetical protein
MTKILLLLCTCALAAAVASCDSRRVAGFAILSIQGGNGPTLDVGTADACEDACCRAENCSGWSFTPVTRTGGCPHQGCCFIKTALPAIIDKKIKADSG